MFLLRLLLENTFVEGNAKSVGRILCIFAVLGPLKAVLIATLMCGVSQRLSRVRGDFPANRTITNIIPTHRPSHLLHMDAFIL